MVELPNFVGQLTWPFELVHVHPRRWQLMLVAEAMLVLNRSGSVAYGWSHRPWSTSRTTIATSMSCANVSLLPDSLEIQVEALRNPPNITLSIDSNQTVERQQNTPRSLPGHSNHAYSSYTQGPQDANLETNAAVADLMTLPPSYFFQLVDMWFKEDHHWAPILDHNALEQSLAALPNPVDRIPDLVLRAVIALKVAYSSQAISLGYRGRRRLSLHLRSQVLIEAMARPSVSSIQALWLVALLDVGSDDIPSAQNIMSMCRRIGEQIGIFRQLLQRIKTQSPALVGPPNRDSFTTDNQSIAITWAVLAVDAVSSLGVSWRDVSAALIEHLSGIAYISVPDFHDSFKTHIHLCAIGLQPLHEFFFAYAKGEHQILENQTMTMTEDMYQNLMSYIRGIPNSHYTILADGVVDYDINYIYSRHLSNAAVIMIFQRYVLDTTGDTQLARDRCLESYHQIVDIIRNISDADAEINSPMFVNFIAVAARFKLILDRALDQVRDPQFDVVMHGINMCGRRWPLARRIDIILRAAIVELDTGVPSGLPSEFWDLKQSGLDISEAMKQWVFEYKPSLYIGSLNGPYA